MKNTLEEIKQGLAYKEGYGDWFEDMLAGSKEICSLYHLDQLVDKVARAAVHKALEEAAEKIRKNKHLLLNRREQNFNPMREYNKGLESAAEILLSLKDKY